MKYLFEIIVIVSVFSGCNTDRLTGDKKSNEEEKIKTRVETFINAYARKDMNAVISMLSSSNSFFFFGSDVAEKNYNMADFQNQLDNDWKLFDTVRFGELRNVSVLISDFGDLAVAIYEVPVEVNVRNSSSKFILRMTNTFVKENGTWQLVQGMNSIPSVGESSAELIQKMK